MVNIGGPIPVTDIWPVQTGAQVTRAAVFTHAFLKVWQKLYRLVMFLLQKHEIFFTEQF